MPGRLPGFAQELADHRFFLLVFALAEVGVADVAVGVDEVLGRPVLVAVGVPGAEFVVLDDRIVDAFGSIAVFDVAGFALERELGAVDADDRQAVLAVALVPGLQVGQGADAVDAAVGPEVDQDDLAAQLPHRQRLVAGGVEPALGVGEFGRLAVFEQLRPLLRRASRLVPAPLRLALGAAAPALLASPAAQGADAVRSTPLISASAVFAASVSSSSSAGLTRKDGRSAAIVALEAEVVVAEHRQRDDDHHRPVAICRAPPRRASGRIRRRPPSISR